MPSRSSLVSRLKAFSPLQLALVALASLVLAGAGTVAVASAIRAAGGRDSGLTGGDQDLAGGSVQMQREPEAAWNVKKAAGDPRDRSDRATGADGRRGGTSEADLRDGGASNPAGAGEASPSSGPKGDTGGAGATGNTGGAGPGSGDTGAGSDTGGAGPRGDTGPGGPTGPEGPSDATPSPAPQTPPAPTGAPGGSAPAVFVVRDANGTTAGTLVGGDPEVGWLTFAHKNRVFAANARTGALELPTVDTSYATDDCTGTPYAPLSLPATSVLRTANPGESGIYEFGRPGSLDVRSIWQRGEDGAPDACLQYVYTNSELAPLRALAAEDRPPTLNGPLRSVRAN
ncbi:MAG: hypothetical protein JHD16_07640 [Solirubrobacteraceae bacterium]|nr:hypothetical protein [Solirubrobacteraceae bacterium]